MRGRDADSAPEAGRGARDRRGAPLATPSGTPLEPVYTRDDVADIPHETEIGEPGAPPFTRGIHPTMYRGRLWTMRQYAGFGTGEETNARFRFLLGQGQTGLSLAFDLPTQMGYDSDDPMALGEVGRVGVAIDTLDDMRRVFAEIPLDAVSVSMTINATASILLALLVVVAEERGVPRAALSGTVQNDILKEYVSRGTYIYPAAPSLRLVTDLFAFCSREMPRWNTISVSGYHIREAGATAAQEIAFTLANGLTYVEAARRAGLSPADVLPRVSFFFNVHNVFFEEVAKFRAARRLWGRLLEERVGVADPALRKLRFHAQTAGSTLTAQEPHVNVVRVAFQALAAVLGGAQSLHTNSYDEALSLPSEGAAALALRTQQALAHETGVPHVVDPLGGSYLVERLTADLERKARAILAEIDALGGVLPAIEAGYFHRAIAESAYAYQRAIERGEIEIVGVNAALPKDSARERSGEPGEGGRARGGDDAGEVRPFRVAPDREAAQRERLAAWRASRDGARAGAALARLEAAARGAENLLPPIIDAVRAGATLGEIAGRLRAVFGSFREKVAF
jgi:methylmalonyl-CoA mutase N-terminal domain/subunit